jgi:taurine transport system permease protein
MSEHKDRQRRRRLLNLASFGAMLLGWIVLTSTGLVSPVFLPSPMALLRTLASLSTSGYQGYSLGHHVMISLARFGIAFLITMLTAIPIGLLMGMNESMRGIMDPPIEITRPMPKLALIPLLIIWFGIGEIPKIVIIILGTFAILSISAMQGVKGVSPRKIQAAYSLGASPWQVFRRVILPGALPEILTGIRQGVGVGVTMLVGAEMIATVDGVAFMAISASDYLLTAVTLVGVLIMAILGYGLDSLVRLIEDRLVHWRGKEG